MPGLSLVIRLLGDCVWSLLLLAIFLAWLLLSDCSGFLHGDMRLGAAVTAACSTESIHAYSESAC